MKTMLHVKHNIATAVLAFAMIFASCNNPIFDPGGDEGGGTGGGKPKCPPSMACNRYATMVQMPCNIGIYGGLWIKTDDGQHYIPCEQTFMTICPINLKAGDRVQIGFSEIDHFKECGDNIATCFAAFPPHKYISVHCLTPLTNNNDGCGKLVVDHTDYGQRNLNVLEAKIEQNKLKIKVGYSGCSPKPNSAFNLSWNQTIMKSNPAQTVLQIVNTQEGELCQAYFTNDLCFDISTIKAIYKQPIQLNIGDKTVMY